jgi:hypothetical protein
MPRARGSASRINKRMSHIMLTLAENTSVKKEKVVKEKKAEVKDEKPKVKKVAAKKVTKKEDK